MTRNTLLWTASKARLQLIKNNGDGAHNWLLLPGGPGLGSESLYPLTHLLPLPGKFWHLDLPGDGSNLLPQQNFAFAHWQMALIEAVSMLENVILVAHSTGGMYVLATPPLEALLTGLVLMDSAPNASWQQSFMQYVDQHPLPAVKRAEKLFLQNPNDDTLKKLTLASLPYLFTPKGLQQDLSFFNDLPINYAVCDWSAQHFDTTYVANWFPKKIPTLLFAGTQDHLTPLRLFKEHQDFQGHNIMQREISHAGHYPWIENPEGVIAVFEEFYRLYFK